MNFLTLFFELGIPPRSGGGVASRTFNLSVLILANRFRRSSDVVVDRRKRLARTQIQWVGGALLIVVRDCPRVFVSSFAVCASDGKINFFSFLRQLCGVISGGSSPTVGLVSVPVVLWNLFVVV